MGMRVTFLSIVLAVAFASPATPAEVLRSSTFQVIDGNRLQIGGREVRLADIVAPERGRLCTLFGKPRDCGVIARAGLLDLTAGATVTCRPSGRTAGRTAYRCTADGYDLSEGMVYTGWAIPLAGAPKTYWRVLKGARSRPRGFWRGTFVEPWPPVARILDKR